MLDCLREITNAFPDGGEPIYVLKFTLPESREGTFSGKAPDRKLVFDVVDRLNASGQFQNVKAVYTLDAGGSSTEVAFSITFTYLGGPAAGVAATTRPTTAPPPRASHNRLTGDEGSRVVLNKRERIIALVTGGVLALLAADRLLLSPLVERSNRVSMDLTAANADLAPEQLFRNAPRMNQRWNQMISAGMKPEVTESESQALRALYDWAQASGVSLQSLQPDRVERPLPQKEFRQVTLRADRDGLVERRRQAPVAHADGDDPDARDVARPELAQGRDGRPDGHVDRLDARLHAARGRLRGRRVGRRARRGWQPGGNEMSPMHTTHTNRTSAVPRLACPAVRDCPATRTARQASRGAAMRAAKVLALFASFALGWATVAAAQNGRESTRPAPAPAAQPAEDFAGRYGMLTEKNIFVRNRPPTRRGGGPVVSSAPRRPEESLVLTGIAIQEGRHVAFIENSAGRSTQRLKPGDTVAGGKVVAIDFDGLDFESNGQKVRVAVGRNFLGTNFVPGSSTNGGNGGGSATTGPAAGNGTAPAAGGGGGGNMSDIERRMRERRQQSGGAAGGDPLAARSGRTDRID